MLLALCSCSVSSQAQAPVAAPQPSQAPRRVGPDLAGHPDWPKANPADVATIVSTVHAFYQAISSPAGGKLDQQRLRSLFVPGGRIVVGLAANGTRAADVIFLTPEEYARSSDRQTVTSGFSDRNPANQVQQFGVMAHVYSTYESREKQDDPKPMARGIKSFELVHSGAGWYIVQVYWDSERDGVVIPEKWMKDGE